MSKQKRITRKSNRKICSKQQVKRVRGTKCKRIRKLFYFVVRALVTAAVEKALMDFL